MSLSFDKWVDHAFPDFYLCNLPWISCQGQLSDLRTQRGSLSQTGTWVCWKMVTSAKLSRFLYNGTSQVFRLHDVNRVMQCFPRLFNHEITVFLLCGYFMGLSGHKCTLWNNQKFDLKFEDFIISARSPVQEDYIWYDSTDMKYPD